MKNAVTSLCIGVALVAAPALEGSPQGAAHAQELAPYLQCVPYAREVSGIQIYGDAYTWWDQAEGVYDRGRKPRVGAVMAFEANDRIQLGHVATVVKVIDKRTVLLDHANWSPINGRRGQIESGVRAVDVSRKNDWSQVRVWYAPLNNLGTTPWPVLGFIYGDGKATPRKAPFEPRPVERSPVQVAAVTGKPSRDFLNAFGSLGQGANPPLLERRAPEAPRQIGYTSPPPIQRRAQAQPPVRTAAGDPYANVLAKYD
ncbi:CHAP domain-containing protein [Parerythrobacter aestuarii]|uniref:CHAP domain-containing protein n=1 Tax=Parerythrobacter aestuarii TaxID=3020909 RepID=UPI0024DE1339|nr:CHAP domain-containing protein [Parerythrobacter aestuarii]